VTVTPLIFATLALAATASHAQPGLLWDNGDWDGLGNTSSERNTLVTESWVVDDIILDDPVVLRGFSWVCAMSPGLEPVASDFIVLTEDLDPLTEMFDLGYTRVFGGVVYGDYEIYEVTLSGLAIDLEPGHYYIGGRIVGDGAGRSVSLLQGAVYGQTAPFFRSEYFGYPDWVPLGDIYFERDAVFKVYGDIIPAPATLALALPCLLANRRRR
jgi:hypothetical protein